MTATKTFPNAESVGPAHAFNGFYVYDLEPQSSELCAIIGINPIDPTLVDQDDLPDGFRWLTADEWELIQKDEQQFSVLCSADGTRMRAATEKEIEDSLFAGPEGLIEADGKTCYVDNSDWDNYTIRTDSELIEHVKGRNTDEAILAAYRGKNGICDFESWKLMIEHLDGWGWIDCDSFGGKRVEVKIDNMV